MERLTEILGDDGGMADDLLRGAVGLDDPIRYDITAIRDFQGLADVVIREQNADSLVAKFANDLLNVSDGDGIDAGERFVKQDEERLSNQAAGHFQTTFFPSRERPGASLSHPQQVKLFQHAERDLPAFLAGETSAQRAQRWHRFENRQEILFGRKSPKD
ncbi:hypothetical protein HRbin36_02666 [bacterium HR36]|nr:hypothetical protein HRbin36_02666 [bacterium HR36]